MSALRDAARQALDAMKSTPISLACTEQDFSRIYGAIDALTAALALLDAQPVIGYLYRFCDEAPVFMSRKQDWAKQKEWKETPLCATPQPAITKTTGETP